MHCTFPFLPRICQLYAIVQEFDRPGVEKWIMLDLEVNLTVQPQCKAKA